MMLHFGIKIITCETLYEVGWAKQKTYQYGVYIYIIPRLNSRYINLAYDILYYKN